MKIIFLEPALQEMNEAAEFYEKQVRGLGQHFLDEIEHVQNKLMELPQLGRLINSNIRRILLNTFPFGLLYQINEDQIIIVAVMHLKRRPNYWKNRKK